MNEYLEFNPVSCVSNPENLVLNLYKKASGNLVKMIKEHPIDFDESNYKSLLCFLSVFNSYPILPEDPLMEYKNLEGTMNLNEILKKL